MAYVRWSVALLALAAALVLLTFGDYGVTWDEEVHVRYGNGVLDYIASGFTDGAAFQFHNLPLLRSCVRFAVRGRITDLTDRAL